MNIEKDVHTEHCCYKHGCKYREDNCTVATFQKPQSYTCEDCSDNTLFDILKEARDRMSETDRLEADLKVSIILIDALQKEIYKLRRELKLTQVRTEINIE